MIRVPALTVSMLCAAPMISCSGTPPATVEGADSGLAPCPSSPNCVSSDADDPEHRIEPFALAAAPEVAWSVLHEETAKLPRSTVVRDTANFLHVECKSGLFGFVDDSELELRPSDHLIAVRSASRTGYTDLGVNRRRVEKLREALRERGGVE